MAKRYPVIRVEYDTTSNKNPSLFTNTYRWGHLDNLINEHRLCFNDDREVTKAFYNTTAGIFTDKNPDLYHDIKTDTAVKLDAAIKDQRLYMIDSPSKSSMATNTDRDHRRFTAAEWQNPDNTGAMGGKRNKSRKPKRRNSRSKRRKTLNKSKK